ncbi:WD40 repeat-like protein [Xylona heveae TC161]|uniref:WD40 repeat-like protein n=1 Tax=Xylona heveae (strain CBS 132557 / TC161) TaxID=1328760 RepID=A0A165I0I1_XYLHT|nr:WD40 repeat-like protein [Xylona heveae TC161]KZF24185.1 WD40 repeat-like protein [Xylona heveae TC161]
MDVHRCRFVPYPPSAVNALAFSHASSTKSSGKGPSTLRLALGRANGDIEIWNPLKGAWFHETTLRGGKDRSVEGLVWTQDPDEHENGYAKPGKLRLFSIGYSTAVTEWDLERGIPAHHSSGNYGEVWCLAAQPRSQSLGKKPVEVNDASDYQKLAAGCADGTVVLLSTADGDLTFLRTLSRPSSKKARVLSITFQNRDTVIAGSSDSTIRVFDVRNGSLLRNISFGGGPSGGPREILVWSVKCLPNGDIVSGDSTGEVRFWDGKNYTLVQRIKSHRADVIDVETSIDGETVISGGMDRRTIVYQRTGGIRAMDRRRWAEVAHQRFHSHDVKTMASFETKHLSIVVSGGLDTMPVILPLREFGKEHHRALSSLPQDPPIESAPSCRLVMSWWEREISIWKMNQSPSKRLQLYGGLSDGLDEPSRKLVAKMLIKGDENITSASISPNGEMLAVSTIAGLKLFTLKSKSPAEGEGLRINKVDVPQHISSLGARRIQFSPDARWLCIITLQNKVRLLRILSDSSSKGVSVLTRLVQLKRLWRDPTRGAKAGLIGSLGQYERTISRIAFSSDSRVLVVGDLSGYLDSWILEGLEDETQDINLSEVDEDDAAESSSDEDSADNKQNNSPTILGQHWIENPSSSLLPRLPSAPLILSFRPLVQKERSNGLGNTALHATRNNPNPHSHELPSQEHLLFALTSDHHIHELEVLKGKLSPWSKRNPTSSLPDSFRGVRDRAMGCLWDISEDRQRIWIYGSSWLWMFDLSQDLSSAEHNLERNASTEDDSSKKRKRKRDPEDDAVDASRDTTGAGSRVASKELRGLGTKMRKINSLDAEQEWISLDTPKAPDSDDEELVTEASSLGRLRPIGSIQTNGNLDDATEADGEGAQEGSVMVSRTTGGTSPAWWYTYKYRPIMGIVPLGSTPHEGDDSNTNDGVEVVLVERPMWDVDLPPRYYGDQEWVK